METSKKLAHHKITYFLSNLYSMLLNPASRNLNETVSKPAKRRIANIHVLITKRKPKASTFQGRNHVIRETYRSRYPEQAGRHGGCAATTHMHMHESADKVYYTHLNARGCTHHETAFPRDEDKPLWCIGAQVFVYASASDLCAFVCEKPIWGRRIRVLAPWGMSRVREGGSFGCSTWEGSLFLWMRWKEWSVILREDVDWMMVGSLVLLERIRLSLSTRFLCYAVFGTWKCCLIFCTRNRYR